MLHHVSWQQYALFTGLLTTVYYAAVYLLYFKKASPIPASQKQETITRQPALFDAAPSLEDDESEAVVYACMDELNAFFDNQQKTRAQKNDIMQAVTAILSKYPSLKTSGYKTSLSRVIALQCENRCSIPLSAAELKEVWG